MLGGVGLTIQAANTVILCEPQWKPSTEDSIDRSMLEVLGEKAELFDLYARESEVATLAFAHV